MNILIAVGIFALIGLVAGILLTVASKVFEVRVDERIEKINDALPQVNCGSCGFSGCSDYAEAIISKGARCDMCRPGGEKTAKEIAKIMGVDVTVSEPEVAFVRCHGDCHITPHKYLFGGVQSCAACNRFYSGSKTCTSGCLGYGDCAHVCPQGAISIIDRIAKVDKSKCIGCGLCVDACPNGLIVVRKISQSVDVTCSSKDSARVTKSLCEGGCVGCKLCEKNCEKGAIHIVDNHAVIDYDKCDNCGKCADVCKIGSVMRLG